MADEAYTFIPDALPARTAERAAFVVQIRIAHGSMVAIADADSGKWIRLQGFPQDVTAETCALMPEGRQLLLASSATTYSRNVLAIQTLASGQLRWLTDLGYGHDHQAAVAPNGETVAVLTVIYGDDDFTKDVEVSLIDLHDGARRRLWSAPGSVSGSSSLSFSPDGRLLAVNYVEPVDDGEQRTIVLDVNDRVVVNEIGASLIPVIPNRAWTSDHELLLYSEEDRHLSILDPVAETRRQLDIRTYGVPYAIVNGRIIHNSPFISNASAVSSIDIESGVERTILAIPRPATIQRLDFAQVWTGANTHRNLAP